MVLLALLLPVRGAVAGAMMCPAGGSGSQTELRPQQVAHLSVGGSMATQGHTGAHHHAHAAGDRHGNPAFGHGDKCGVCAAGGSFTPLWGAIPAVAPALESASAEFPSLSAPAPSFLSDGQERPPRRI